MKTIKERIEEIEKEIEVIDRISGEETESLQKSQLLMQLFLLVAADLGITEIVVEVEPTEG